MMRLDADQILRFREDGFLAFDTGLSSDAISALRETLARLHIENVGFEEGALYDALGVDDGSEPARFPQIMHPRSFAPELIGSNFYKLARGIAEQILGTAVRFKADISLMKPALIGDATPWHQDEAFQDPAFDYEEISFWLALQPVDEANSCMAYLPGRTKDQCSRTDFRATIRGSMRWNVSAVSTRVMPSRARYRRRLRHAQRANLAWRGSKSLGPRADGVCSDLRQGADAGSAAQAFPLARAASTRSGSARTGMAEARRPARASLAPTNPNTGANAALRFASRGPSNATPRTDELVSG